MLVQLTLLFVVIGSAYPAVSIWGDVLSGVYRRTSQSNVKPYVRRTSPRGTKMDMYFNSSPRTRFVMAKSTAPRSASMSSAKTTYVQSAECQVPPGMVCAGTGRFRTADGTCNNRKHPTWGAAGRPQDRILRAEYAAMDRPRTYGGRGYDRPLPSAREVSQKIHSPDSVASESRDLTQFFTVWGQFLDHDMTHTPKSQDTDGSALDCCNQPLLFPRRDVYWISPTHSSQTAVQNPNCFSIKLTPSTDRFFRTSCMNFVRSKVFSPSSNCYSDYREQGSTQTAFVDGSQVYGASLGDQLVLRTGLGGQMTSSPQGDLLPRNDTTMCTKRPNSGDYCFGSGDPRVNEHPMLTSTHIVFHRLHNDVAADLARLNPHWDDERLFQEARRIVGAILQHVTYAEYLPLVLGEREMDRFELTVGGARRFLYDPDSNPTIINSFSTAAFRFGHSMINSHNSYGYQKVNLRDMFFRPNFVQKDQGDGLTMVLNGLLRDHSMKGDRLMSKDVTDHLFMNKAGAGQSLDLASLNIQRGRDHGLPGCNAFRAACGLPSLQEDIALGNMRDVPFSSVYSNLDDVDLFTCGLAEKPLPGAAVGPTFACIIARQFHNVKFGDRFWYEHGQHQGAFTPQQIRAIEKIGLSDIMCHTTAMSAVQVKPFLKPSAGNPVRECLSVLPFDWSAWAEI